MKTILVFVAHSDDQVLGPGGTIAAYAKRGYAVYTVVCSFGEFSHPHLKPEVIRKIRIQEAKRADKILGGSGVSFLGLREGKFIEDIGKDKARLKKNLVKRLRKMKPEIIITHNKGDTHPDHKAAARILLDAAEKAKTKAEIFTFTIYNPSGSGPRICVDISDTFNLKIKALHEFKSQIGMTFVAVLVNFLYASVYFRALYAGFRNGVRYAELFRKVSLGR